MSFTGTAPCGTPVRRGLPEGGGPDRYDGQFAVLEDELSKGPAAHDFEDEHWILARSGR